jgi:quercetin dioxygenase-like cupin family protein
MLVRQLEKSKALVAASEGHQLSSGYVLLKPGKEVGEHTTGSGEELIVIMDGVATVSCGGKTRTVRAPATVFVPTHTIHNVRNNSKRLLRYVYVHVAAMGRE